MNYAKKKSHKKRFIISSLCGSLAKYNDVTFQVNRRRALFTNMRAFCDDHGSKCIQTAPQAHPENGPLKTSQYFQ